jgi:hypothetical protein
MADNKKRIAIILVVLFLLSIVSLGLYFLSIRGSLGERRADTLISEANKSEKRATTIISRLKEVMKVEPMNDPQTAKRRYMETDREVKEALNEMESSISSLQEARRLNVVTWKKNYAEVRVQSLTSRIKMLNAMERWFSRMEFIADFLQRIDVARKKFDLGIDKLNEAIDDANAKNYDRSKANASKGKQLFDEAQQLLQEAEKMETDTDLGAILEIVSNAQDFASLTIQLAEAGAADKIEEYNDIAQKGEEAKANVLKEWDVEVVKEPKKWYTRKNRKIDQSVHNYELEARQTKQEASHLYQTNKK